MGGGDDAGTSVSEVSDQVNATATNSQADQPAPGAKRFTVLAFLIALGTLGILGFWVYRTFASIRKDADDVGRVFGLLAPPPRKSRLPRIAGKG
jgi:hypothetical protein